MKTKRRWRMGIPMFYVYLLGSVNFPDQSYVGLTINLTTRLQEHNSGKSLHTKKYMPWKIQMYTAFRNKEQAVAFEKYLKTSSGKTFIRRHFW